MNVTTATETIATVNARIQSVSKFGIYQGPTFGTRHSTEDNGVVTFHGDHDIQNTDVTITVTDDTFTLSLSKVGPYAAFGKDGEFSTSMADGATAVATAVAEWLKGKRVQTMWFGVY